MKTPMKSRIGHFKLALLGAPSPAVFTIGHSYASGVELPSMLPFDNDPRPSAGVPVSLTGLAPQA